MPDEGVWAACDEFVGVAEGEFEGELGAEVVVACEPEERACEDEEGAEQECGCYAELDECGGRGGGVVNDCSVKRWGREVGEEEREKDVDLDQVWDV